MKKITYAVIIITLITLFGTQAMANAIDKTVNKFRRIQHTTPFFKHAYGYAVFPTVGAGGFIIGASYGKGSVFVNGKQTGTSTLTAASIGFQLGGKAFSEIIFFKDKAAYDTFTQGSFAFGAKASATVLTVGAAAEVGSSGASTSAGTGALGHNKTATGAGSYVNGMATFVLAKGGLMYKAAIGGQKFSFTALKQ